jgi:hypothetical protein
MINIFQFPYETRLQQWRVLRTSLEDKDIKTKCIEVDKWWQKAPLVNHYLHVDFVKDWPGPWVLLADNEYCYIARGLGMVYTLLLLGIKDIDFCLAKDDNNEEAVLVVVDNAKYVMNYYPDTVISNSLSDFKITSHIDMTKINTKL